MLEYLNRQIDVAIHEKDKRYAEKKYHKFMKWLREVPVVGFNSSKVMYNLGVGPRFAYVSASARPQNNKLPWGPF